MHLNSTLKMFALFVMAGALCFAESWTGRLIDAACHDQAQGKPSACTPTAKTTSFGIETNEGKVVKLDASGNMKAAQVMKTSTKPDAEVTINGALNGDTVKVDSIVSQQ